VPPGFNKLLYLLIKAGEGVADEHWARPSLGFGLVLACLVFAVAAAGYLLAWRERRWAVPIVAAVLAAGNIVGISVLLAVPEDDSPVAPAQPTPSWTSPSSCPPVTQVLRSMTWCALRAIKTSGTRWRVRGQALSNGCFLTAAIRRPRARPPAQPARR